MLIRKAAAKSPHSQFAKLNYLLKSFGQLSQPSTLCPFAHAPVLLDGANKWIAVRVHAVVASTILETIRRDTVLQRNGAFAPLDLVVEVAANVVIDVPNIILRATRLEHQRWAVSARCTQTQDLESFQVSVDIHPVIIVPPHVVSPRICPLCLGRLPSALT